MLEVPEASEQKSRANQERDGQRHFDDDERGAQALPGRSASRAFAQRVGRVLAGHLDRWNETEGQDRRDRHRQREENYGDIESGLTQARQARRPICNQEPRRSGADRKARQARYQREQQRLRQLLSEDSPARSTERHANGELLPASGAAREQEAGDVRARDEQ